MDMGFQSSLGEIPDLDPMGFYCSRYGILVGSQIYQGSVHLQLSDLSGTQGFRLRHCGLDTQEIPGVWHRGDGGIPALVFAGR